MPEQSGQNTGEGLIPQPHGGALAPPFPAGHSGNPGGRPAYKRLTEAYKRILDLAPEELDTFKPATVAEHVALAQVRLALESTPPAKEIGDRVEGKVVETVRLEGNLSELGAIASRRAESDDTPESPQP